MLDPTQAFNDIQDLLSTGPWDVYADEVPEDGTINWKNGLFDPFVVVYFGGPIRSGTDRSLISTRYDSTVLTCTVEVYAPKAQDARSIKGKITDMLTGFRPTDCGELTIALTNQYSRASNNVRPTNYISAVGFSCVSNLSTENAG